jgi:hypothetical protein
VEVVEQPLASGPDVNLTIGGSDQPGVSIGQDTSGPIEASQKTDVPPPADREALSPRDDARALGEALGAKQLAPDRPREQIVR